ncbi:Fic family protein [Aquibium sp. ELW1220]|uniref:Fic family protein n=1 Tax=Aquibium sp. ELW1220 TaxID=2976766 RepID=UPI0025B11279|nr:Fic family protein [Aquibium sp. ELW1220]MDN2582726.1 Fic family protein [Aquibium sp. ELW1220]
MDLEAFRRSPTGRLVPTVAGQFAFVPATLPPPLDFAKLVMPLAEAMQAIGELNAAGRSLANPSLVIRPLQRREALLSSSMEGTYTTADALALAVADDGAEVDASTIEVRNYITAFQVAERLLKELPLSNRLIKTVHRTLLSAVGRERGANKRPGEYKDQQNFIGGRNRQIENARFVPPPPIETESAMAELERYLNRLDRAGIPAIVDAALFHYQFETIHPFADGNGRVGRILIPIYLMQEGVLENPLLYLSPAVEGRKDDYVDLMLAVSREGAWTDWIAFFLEMVTASCRSASSTIRELEAMRSDFRQRISERRSSARVLTIVDDLFARPVTSIPQIANLLGVTYPAAKSAVDRLVELGILDELQTTSNPRRFICWPIVDLSEGRARRLPDVDVTV